MRLCNGRLEANKKGRSLSFEKQYWNVVDGISPNRSYFQAELM